MKERTSIVFEQICLILTFATLIVTFTDFRNNVGAIAIFGLIGTIRYEKRLLFSRSKITLSHNILTFFLVIVILFLILQWSPVKFFPVEPTNITTHKWQQPKLENYCIDENGKFIGTIEDVLSDGKTESSKTIDCTKTREKKESRKNDDSIDTFFIILHAAIVTLKTISSIAINTVIALLYVSISVIFAFRISLCLTMLIVKPLSTLRSIPRTWLKRQFYTSMTTPIEIVPGITVKQFEKYAEEHLRKYNNVPTFSAYFVSFFLVPMAYVICYISRLLFKLSAPVIYSAVYILYPLSENKKALRRKATFFADSSFKTVLIFSAHLTLFLFFSKIVAYLNFASIRDYLSNIPLVLNLMISLQSITLWQACAVLNASLFLLSVWHSDTIVQRIKGNETQSIDRITVLIELYFKIRVISAIYTTICMIILCTPQLRNSF